MTQRRSNRCEHTQTANIAQAGVARSVAMATSRCSRQTYSVLVGDVQSVVQPVDGQSQTCAASSASRLVDHLGRLLLTSCVESDPVDSVT